ncbi:uncharacterized protein PV07_04716 [Cladophialophora immunda]|uniref:Uncharacterized protein n=1 Tax=Cladophialophora immunda TaxID=569365 RepID=A0A0D2CCP6_9EURO|nr:uncharacterized protein PV07_04716 [Cladophialophora immunda]KIW28853.1 hypothetical protein PV07_04716 [Cladophialophora immunda]
MPTSTLAKVIEMPSNDHGISNIIRAIIGVQVDPGKRELRPRCIRCGKARSAKYRRNSASTEICSRPACDSYVKGIVPTEEAQEKHIVLEVHHYFHEHGESDPSPAQPQLAEVSGESAAERRLEMPDNWSHRVTRAMARQYEANINERPPSYRSFNKPTLVLSGSTPCSATAAQAQDSKSLMNY